MGVKDSGGVQEKEQLKTQLAFLCDGVDEKVVVAAMRDYLEEYGWVMVSESRFKQLNRKSRNYTSMCEQMVGTLPAVVTELNQIREVINLRIKAVERLTTIALEPVFSEKTEE